MKAKKSNILTLKRFKDINYGMRGTKKHDKLEEGYKNFKTDVLS